jgi:cell wall-associated NlpC family hydrolase
VEAARFVKGQVMRVTAPQAPMRRDPSHGARLDSEALRGELVTVFDTNAEGWAWAQLADDRYVGWIPRAALGTPAAEPTHKVSALRTFVFSEPDIKSPPLEALSFGARATVIGEAEDRNACYALIAPKGAVVVQHVAALDAFETDWASVAERFLGVPYLWGGKTSLGMDCSGLVQVALGACGIRAPRDSDMQAAVIGVPVNPDAGKLLRGDLVFWPGHVGIMGDATAMVHANAHQMAVVIEPLAVAVERFAHRGVALASIRRTSAD